MKQAVHPADIRYTLKSTQGGHTTEFTKLIRGQRNRTESRTTILTQCDLKRSIMINDRTKKYFINPLSRSMPPNILSAPASAPTRGGTVTKTQTTTDTGDRKQMFGYTARRLKITFFQEPNSEACDQHKVHWEEDGWYIDLDPTSTVCSSAIPPTPPSANQASCRDKYEIKRLGITTPVFPLIKTLTYYNDNGDPTSTSTWEVVELSTDPLDQSLFEIPPGYTEAKTALELDQAPPSERASC